MNNISCRPAIELPERGKHAAYHQRSTNASWWQSSLRDHRTNGTRPHGQDVLQERASQVFLHLHCHLPVRRSNHLQYGYLQITSRCDLHLWQLQQDRTRCRRPVLGGPEHQSWTGLPTVHSAHRPLTWTILQLAHQVPPVFDHRFQVAWWVDIYSVVSTVLIKIEILSR